MNIRVNQFYGRYILQAVHFTGGTVVWGLSGEAK